MMSFKQVLYFFIDESMGIDAGAFGNDRLREGILCHEKATDNEVLWSGLHYHAIGILQVIFITIIQNDNLIADDMSNCGLDVELLQKNASASDKTKTIDRLGLPCKLNFEGKRT